MYRIWIYHVPDSRDSNSTWLTITVDGAERERV